MTNTNPIKPLDMAAFAAAVCGMPEPKGKYDSFEYRRNNGEVLSVSYDYCPAYGTEAEMLDIGSIRVVSSSSDARMYRDLRRSLGEEEMGRIMDEAWEHARG